MRLRLHQYVEDRAPGDVIELERERGAWLVAHGYASRIPQERSTTPAEVRQVKSIPEPPATSATKPAWVEYAVSQGMSQKEAEKLTKAALMERFGG